jgi:hypothetical protein
LRDRNGVHIKDKPFLAAALMGAGATATEFALHQRVEAAEATVAATIAGMGLMAAANFLFADAYPRIAELPRIRTIGWRPRILFPDSFRMLHALKTGFASSPLPGKRRILNQLCDLRVKALRFGERAERLMRGIELLESDEVSPSSAIWGRPDENLAAPLFGLPRTLSVSCSVIEPAVVAALLDMRYRLHIPLSISFRHMNGVAQITAGNERINDGNPFDVIVVALAPLLSSDAKRGGPAIRDLYELIVPVHREGQRLLRSKLRDKDKFPDLKGVEKIHFLDDSSCKEQYIGLRTEGVTAAKDDPWGLSDLPDILNGLDGDAAAILYEPLASRLIKLGLLTPIPKYDYDLWVSMFALTETLQKFGIRTALMECFVASWVFCKAYPSHAWDLLVSDREITNAFQEALLTNALR